MNKRLFIWVLNWLVFFGIIVIENAYGNGLHSNISSDSSSILIWCLNSSKVHKTKKAKSTIELTFHGQRHHGRYSIDFYSNLCHINVMEVVLWVVNLLLLISYRSHHFLKRSSDFWFLFKCLIKWSYFNRTLNRLSRAELIILPMDGLRLSLNVTLIISTMWSPGPI